MSNELKAGDVVYVTAPFTVAVQQDDNSAFSQELQSNDCLQLIPPPTGMVGGEQRVKVIVKREFVNSAVQDIDQSPAVTAQIWSGN